MKALARVGAGAFAYAVRVAPAPTPAPGEQLVRTLVAVFDPREPAAGVGCVGAPLFAEDAGARVVWREPAFALAELASVPEDRLSPGPAGARDEQAARAAWAAGSPDALARPIARRRVASASTERAGARGELWAVRFERRAAPWSRATVRAAQRLDLPAAAQPAPRGATIAVSLYVETGCSMLDALARASLWRRGVCARSGLLAAQAGERARFAFATSDPARLHEEPAVGLLIVDGGPSGVAHARALELVEDSLRAGVSVLVGPSALFAPRLQAALPRLRALAAGSGSWLIPGLWRRHDDLVRRARALLVGRSEPLTMHALLPGPWGDEDAWLADAVAWCDVMGFLANAPAHAVSVSRVGGPPVLTVTFADGSLGTLTPRADAAGASGELSAVAGTRRARIEGARLFAERDGASATAHRRGGRAGALAAMLESAVAALRRPDAPPCDGRDYAAALALRHAIDRSLETGQRERVGARA